MLNSYEVLSQHPDPRGLGWRCGDYFYYALSSNVDADFYWLLEPDVDFTFSNIADFFDKFETIRDDALLCYFDVAPDNWCWTNSAKLIDSLAYKAFFPLSRLSKKAINICLSERKILTKKLSLGDYNIQLYPNDEALVATACMKEGLVVSSLNDVFPDSFHYFNLAKVTLSPNAQSLIPSKQVIHPAKTRAYFIEKVNELVTSCVIRNAVFRELTQNVIIHMDDVDLIVKDLTERYTVFLYGILHSPVKGEKYFAKIKEKLDSYAKGMLGDKKYNIWVFNDTTLVLDVYSQGSPERVYTIEYIISKDNVVCNIFPRRDEGDKFHQNIILSDNMAFLDNKIRLFCVSLPNSSVLSQVANSINSFHQIIYSLI